MRKSDIGEILVIEKESFLTPWSRIVFENEIQADYAYPFILTQSDSPNILGYLCCWMIMEKCHILNLSIHYSHQRKGLASRLIQFLFEYGPPKGVKHYYLEVRESNKKAISLYNKNNFKISGILKNYYTDTGEDALIMERRHLCH